MTFGIFEVERLIEYIPIDCDTFQIDGRLAKDTSIDSKFYFEDIDGIATRLGIIEVIQEVGRMKGESRFITLVSFRDIVRLLNKFLNDARIEEVVQKQRYTQLQLIKGFSSLQYLGKTSTLNASERTLLSIPLFLPFLFVRLETSSFAFKRMENF